MPHLVYVIKLEKLEITAIKGNILVNGTKLYSGIHFGFLLNKLKGMPKH